MISQNYKTRGTIIFFIFCLLYLIILMNLYLIQILQKPFFTQLAKRQHNMTITLPAPRAPILDRTGKKFLALNKDSVSAFIVPASLESPEKVSQFLKVNFPQAYRRMKANPHAQFLYIKRRLTKEQIELINQSGITDIKLLNEPSRYYPLEAAAPLIGITDIDNKGVMGLELFYNQQLSGTPTTYELEKDCSGRFYFTKETKVAGKDSVPLQLTIDSELQFLVYEELKDTVQKFNAKEGAVIIMDPFKGDIIAMTSYPSFDPNNTGEIDLEKTKNKVVTEAYELGSVIKICSALAALEEKVVTPDELIDCKNAKTAIIDGRVINTVKENGIIPFEQVIAQSNNIGIAQVAKRLDTKLYDHYLNLGFSKKTLLHFPGEAKGYLNPPSKWSKQSIISLSYGYEVAATLAQLARVFSIIANGGYWVEPRLILGEEAPKLQKKLFRDDTISEIKKMMEKTSKEGTAKKAAINGYRVMSKTGTANLLDNGHYNPDKNIFTCAGIVEKDSYQRVIIVFIKEVGQKDLYASSVAAPLFERVAQKLLIHDKIL